MEGEVSFATASKAHAMGVKPMRGEVMLCGLLITYSTTSRELKLDMGHQPPQLGARGISIASCKALLNTTTGSHTEYVQAYTREDCHKNVMQMKTLHRR